MNHLTKKSIAFYPRLFSLAKMSGEPGSGAGRGGGGGGSIKEAGGAFGKLEVAREEEYFYKKDDTDYQCDCKCECGKVSEKIVEEENEEILKLFSQTKEEYDHEKEIEKHNKRLKEIDNNCRPER